MLSSGLAIPLSALATGPLFARALGPDGRGAVAAVTVPVFLLLPLAQLGLFEAVTYFVAVNPDAWRRVAKTGYRLALLQGLWVAAVLYFLAPALMRHYKDLVTLLRLLALTMPIIYMQVVTRAVAQGRGQYALVIRERWAWAGGRLALVVALFAAGVLTVTSAAWVQWGSGIVCGIALLPVLRGLRNPAATPTRDKAEARVDAQALYEFGLRSWVGSVSAVLVLRLDQVLLAVLVDSRELGLYAVAASLAEVPAQGLQSLRDGVFSRAASQRSAITIPRTCRVVIALATSAAVAAVVLTPFVVPLLFGRDFDDAIVMADILLIGTPFAAMALMTGAGLQAVGRPGLVSITQLGGLIATIPLLLALVPHIGARGAAVATAASYAVTGVSGVILFCRVSNTHVRTCLLLRPADITAVVNLVLRRGTRA